MAPGYFSKQTRVPIPSLVTTRAMLPGVRMLKTTIGKLLSMHREIADASITFNCFSNTSWNVMQSKRVAVASFIGSAE